MERNFVPFQPAVIRIAQNKLQLFACSWIPICVPLPGATRSRRTSGPIIHVGLLPLIPTVGVAQYEHPFSYVARTDFRRRDDARRNDETHFLKIGDDAVETEGEMAGDVFEEHALRFDFSDDSANVRPEMTGVVLTLSPP